MKHQVKDCDHYMVTRECKFEYESGIVILRLSLKEKRPEYTARSWFNGDGRHVVEVYFDEENFEKPQFVSELMKGFDETEYYPMLNDIEKDELSLIWIPWRYFK